MIFFYCFASIQNQKITRTLPGSNICVLLLYVGVALTGLFAGVFLFYTNGLLLTAAGLVAGIIFGVLLEKLFFLLRF